MSLESSILNSWLSREQIYITVTLYSFQKLTMPNSCICCGRIKGKGDKVSMFRLPADNTRRQQWLDALNLTEDDVNEHTRVCSRHFLHGDPSNTPALDLGKRFASPKKMDMDRSKRAVKRARRSLHVDNVTNSDTIFITCFISQCTYSWQHH